MTIVFRPIGSERIITFCFLMMASLASAQLDFLQISPGFGFSSMNAEVAQDSVLYAQGTMSEYLDWNGERIFQGQGDDIFFLASDKKGKPIWYSSYGGGGVERITTRPYLQEAGDLWLFHGDAIDSLNIDGVRYRPSVSSFFSFVGYQQVDGTGIRTFAFESEGPLEVSAASWVPGSNDFYLAGRAEAPILHSGDTLVRGINSPYGYLIRMDTSFAVLNAKIIAGEVRPFDLLILDSNLYLGANVRDSVLLEGEMIQARVQDFDCLVIGFDADSVSLHWHQLLGGVYDKNGVRVLSGWAPGNVLVSGDFIGVIGDGEGRSFESNGFDPDLFFWEFTPSGETVRGLATGSPGNEIFVDARMDIDRLGILIEFSEMAEIFDQQFPAREDGRHIGIFSVNDEETAQIEQIFLGAPVALGFDLWKWNGQWGMLGGFGEKLLDQDGRVLLEDMGSGQIDYFIWPVEGTTNVKDAVAIGIKVYPNPFHDRIIVEVPFGQQNDLTYRINDIMGRSMKSGIIMNAREEIDLSQINGSGIYILEISRNGISVLSNLIFKQR